MKKYLISDSGNFYKANLHCHSTISDGRLTPEQLKKAYMEHGYSILAYTDHDALIGHNDLTDENFLALNGFEVEITEGMGDMGKDCHICFVALKPDNLIQPCYHRTEYMYTNEKNYRDQVLFDESKPDFERIYSPECISQMMKEGRDNGFFVTYNHPTWSMETYNEYSKYEHMHAMEICNYGCVAYGWPEYNEKEYDEMLRCGKRIFCISADDNHNCHPPQSRHYDSFGGFIMVKAERLEYKTVTDALLAGNFYASQGPEIYDLWLEDEKLYITCSNASSIVLGTGRRRVKAVYRENGEALTKACFDIKKEDIYVRITVTDHSGLHANNNAYFTDELLRD